MASGPYRITGYDDTPVLDGRLRRADETIAALQARADAMADALEESCTDCEAMAREEWGWPDIHPSNQRRYDRDMEIIAKWRAALAAYRSYIAAHVSEPPKR